MDMYLQCTSTHGRIVRISVSCLWSNHNLGTIRMKGPRLRPALTILSNVKDHPATLMGNLQELRHKATAACLRASVLCMDRMSCEIGVAVLCGGSKALLSRIPSSSQARPGSVLVAQWWTTVRGSRGTHRALTWDSCCPIDLERDLSGSRDQMGRCHEAKTPVVSAKRDLIAEDQRKTSFPCITALELSAFQSGAERSGDIGNHMSCMRNRGLRPQSLAGPKEADLSVIRNHYCELTKLPQADDFVVLPRSQAPMCIAHPDFNTDIDRPTQQGSS
ncbi:hypothetical protein B0H65DRAFT_542047 [Neurospora tetraspora]|uniref:Uncharacterized protein n=1 Tax=Neurospora tetraspora TaxID=94610 RepID=A0AAE0J969_9PEZI|nr:hypothetical protein B0H65DRAFT_542047 [Neurospora tetraspora]